MPFVRWCMVKSSDVLAIRRSSHGKSCIPSVYCKTNGNVQIIHSFRQSHSVEIPKTSRITAHCGRHWTFWCPHELLRPTPRVFAHSRCQETRSSRPETATRNCIQTTGCATPVILHKQGPHSVHHKIKLIALNPFHHLPSILFFALLCSIRFRRLISPLIGRDAAGSKVEYSLFFGSKLCKRGRPKNASWKSLGKYSLLLPSWSQGAG